MMTIGPGIQVEDSDVDMTFIHGGGPGGQNVNKTATAVQLRFHLDSCRVLNNALKERLRHAAGNRLTAGGDIVIDSRRHRRQAQNRAEAIRRLYELVEQVMVPPKKRRSTRPPVSSVRERLRRKRLHSRVKRSRRPPDGDD